MAKQKRRVFTWEELIELAEKYKGTPVRQLEDIFEKDSSWINRFFQFYEASEEEKETLATKHTVFKALNNLYTKYKNKKQMETSPYSLTPPKGFYLKPFVITPLGANDQENTEEEITQEENIEDLKKIISRLTIELHHTQKLKNIFLEENTELSRTVTYYKYLANDIEIKNKDLKKEIKYLKILYLISVFVIFIIFIIGGK